MSAIARQTRGVTLNDDNTITEVQTEPAQPIQSDDGNKAPVGRSPSDADYHSLLGKTYFYENLCKLYSDGHDNGELSDSDEEMELQFDDKVPPLENESDTEAEQPAPKTPEETGQNPINRVNEVQPLF